MLGYKMLRGAQRRLACMCRKASAWSRWWICVSTVQLTATTTYRQCCCPGLRRTATAEDHNHTPPPRRPATQRPCCPPAAVGARVGSVAAGQRTAWCSRSVRSQRGDGLRALGTWSNWGRPTPIAKWAPLWSAMRVWWACSSSHRATCAPPFFRKAGLTPNAGWQSQA
jgi:hypothetical protein